MVRHFGEIMNIVHISTADINGGAAKAAYALHKNLLALGHHSTMLVGWKDSHDKEIDAIWFQKSRLGRRVQQLVKIAEEYTGLQYLLQPFKRSFLRHPLVKNADVIHLHNIHGNYFSFTILPELSNIAPIVWTLYDMWPMSGHGAYPEMFGCTVWKTGIGRCSCLADYPPIKRDTEAYLMKRKKEMYEQSNIEWIGPSQWMCKMARESFLLRNFPVHYIPQGIDATTFRPGDAAAARQRFNIPADVNVVMVSALPQAPRKGLSYFLEALNHITTRPRPWILVVGSRGLLKTAPKAFSLREVGYINDPKEFNDCFLASNISVLPTLADNLPLTILDSLSAGTPVVSFDVGGVPEVVQSMETGYLARAKDAKDLAHGIDVLLSDPAKLSRMSQKARQCILEAYTLPLQAKHYLTLYDERITSGL